MDLYSFLLLFLITILSLVFGSFISAITYRIPKGIDFVSGRSFCDSCKKKLFWYDNIPLLSFIFYKGKSRCCIKKISFRYPLIELASLVGALLIYVSFPFNLFVLYYALFLLTLTIFVIDLEYQYIPDELSFLILFLSFFVSGISPFESLFSGLILSLVILLLNLITKGRGMGLGDVKLVLGLGMWLGIEKGINWLIVTFLTGGVIASILLISGKATRKTKIAFGPFIIIAFWFIVLSRYQFKF